HVSRSLAALGTLVALVAGIPAALVVTVGWPLPRALPHLGDITSALAGQSIDDAFVVKTLAVVCWLAWAQFVACIVAEIVGWRRGRAPRAVPFAAVVQPLVAQLVVTAALLVHLVPRSSPVPVLLTATPVVHVHEEAPSAAPVRPPTVAAESDHSSASALTYVVKPRDDLWSLAERHLGDGHRWRELFHLNRGRPQPRGRALRPPTLLRPGWILRFPADAVGLVDAAESVAPQPGHDGGSAPPLNRPVEAGAAQTPVGLLAPTMTPCPAPSPPTVPPAPAPDPPSAPTSQDVGAAEPTPEPSPSLAPAASGSPSAEPPRPPHEGNDPSGRRAPVGVLGAGLLAGGVVVTLDRLRRAQQRRRPRDRAIRMPAPAAIPTEVALRRAATTSSGDRLDLALRAFAECAATRRAGDPPSVSAVQVGSNGVEILLRQGIEAEPGPFSVSAAGQVWTLPAAVADTELEDGRTNVGAPLPALVSVGNLDDSTVLIDLESAGCTALVGDEEWIRNAFRAMVLELSTSLWADTLDVVLIASDTEAFQPLERIRVANTLAEILPDLAATAGGLSDALTAVRAPTTLAARLQGTGGDGWIPTIVLCEDAGSDPDAFAQLLALAGTGARGLAVVALGDVPDAGRTVHLHDDLVEVTPPGVRLTATGPTAQQVAQIEEILTAAADCDGVETETSDTTDDAPEESSEAVVLDAPFSEHDFDVHVRLLGPVEIEGTKQPIDRRKAVELVVYLATHPKGLDDERLKTALWPDERAPQASFNTTVTRARTRLGTAADGSHHLPHVIATGGVYRVGPRVTTDLTLLERRLAAARDSAPDVAMRILRAGLEMVRGSPCAGASQGYEWAYAEGLVAR